MNSKVGREGNEDRQRYKIRETKRADAPRTNARGAPRATIGPADGLSRFGNGSVLAGTKSGDLHVQPDDEKPVSHPDEAQTRPTTPVPHHPSQTHSNANDPIIHSIP